MGIGNGLSGDSKRDKRGQPEPVPQPAPQPIPGTGLSQAMLGTLSSIEARLREVVSAVKQLPQGPQTVDRIEVQQLYGGGAVTDYGKPREFDVTDARVDEDVGITGDQLLALTTAESLETVGVKLNRQDAPIIYFNDSNPIYGHFDRVYLSHDAFSGGGTLKLLNSRGRIYSPTVTSSPPKLAPNQKKFSLLVTYRAADGDPIPGNTVESLAAYTVPAGWRLFIGGAVITCNISCIQKVVMTHTPGIIGDYRYDMRGDLIFGVLSSTILDPADVLTIYTYNNHNDYADFSISVVGVLEALEV